MKELDKLERDVARAMCWADSDGRDCMDACMAANACRHEGEPYHRMAKAAIEVAGVQSLTQRVKSLEEAGGALIDKAVIYPGPYGTIRLERKLWEQFRTTLESKER